MNGERSIEFLLPETTVAQLAPPPWRTAGIGAGSVRAREIVLLDTFDRRLLRRGRVLAWERTSGRLPVCSLRDLSAQKPNDSVMLDCADPPRFAWDVADHDFGSVLRELIDVRALLPLCRLRGRSHPIAAFPLAYPESAQLVWNRYALLTRSGRSRLLGERLTVCWPAADDRQVRRFLGMAVDQGLLSFVDVDVAQRALAAEPQPASAVVFDRHARISSAQRSDAALKLHLAELFQCLLLNENGVIEAIDTEFLHDFRVAVRRCRALLSQLKGVFPEATIERFRGEFAWLGQITGPMRDMDVYLLDFEKFRGLVPESLSDDLDPLRGLLSAKASVQHLALSASLRTARYRLFKERWQVFLGRANAKRPSAPHALEPIGTLASRRIWRLYQRVSDAALALAEDTPSELLHELRKTCKKLRYLMEFVEPFHDADLLRKPLKDLKQLQTHLGAFQDAQVQIEHLTEWFTELHQDPQMPPATLLGIGALLGQLDRLQRKRRKKIMPAVRRLTRKRDRARFKALFKLVEAQQAVDPEPARTVVE